jgi:integrase
MKKPQIRPQTHLIYTGYVTNYITPRLGHIKAIKLTSVEVETAAAEWAHTNSPKHVNSFLARLAAIYRYARKLGVKHNPMDDVERLRTQTTPEQLEQVAFDEIADYGDDQPEVEDNTVRRVRPDEVYSAKDLRAIIDAAQPGVEKVLLMTAIMLGLRRGELLGLRWSEIDLKEATLKVNRTQVQLPERLGLGSKVLGRPKTRKAYRKLKIEQPLLNEFRQWKLQSGKSAMVFVDTFGKPMGFKHAYRILARVCKKAGVRKLSMHNLRHSFASQLLIAGVPLLRVSHLMGHSKPSTTLDVYAHWAASEDSDAEAVLASRIFAAEEKGEVNTKSI